MSNTQHSTPKSAKGNPAPVAAPLQEDEIEALKFWREAKAQGLTLSMGDLPGLIAAAKEKAAKELADKAEQERQVIAKTFYDASVALHAAWNAPEAITIADFKDLVIKMETLAAKDSLLSFALEAGKPKRAKAERKPAEIKLDEAGNPIVPEAKPAEPELPKITEADTKAVLDYMIELRAKDDTFRKTPDLIAGMVSYPYKDSTNGKRRFAAMLNTLREQGKVASEGLRAGTAWRAVKAGDVAATPAPAPSAAPLGNGKLPL